MTVLSAQTISRRIRDAVDPFNIDPFHPFQDTVHGQSYGLGPAGYDIRVDGDSWSYPPVLCPGDFKLVSSLEYVSIPDDLIAIVHDKSTWARQGLAVQNTVLEPGWQGFITLELTNHRQSGALTLFPGAPIAQIVFHKLDEATREPYNGKYQDQSKGPQEAITEG